MNKLITFPLPLGAKVELSSTKLECTVVARIVIMTIQDLHINNYIVRLPNGKKTVVKAGWIKLLDDSNLENPAIEYEHNFNYSNIVKITSDDEKYKSVEGLEGMITNVAFMSSDSGHNTVGYSVRFSNGKNIYSLYEEEIAEVTL